jgi:chemotaxis protein histidine kinase CheA
MSKNLEFIPSPTSVADASDNPGVEPASESQLRDTEARLAALAADYEAWARKDLNNAEQALEAAKAIQSGRQPQIQKVFSIAHDMKGQGSTFGYALITLIAGSLCDFIRHIPDATDAELKVVTQHLAVMKVVLDNQIKGSGGAFAEEIAAKLEHFTTAARG